MYQTGVVYFLGALYCISQAIDPATHPDELIALSPSLLLFLLFPHSPPSSSLLPAPTCPLRRERHPPTLRQGGSAPKTKLSLLEQHANILMPSLSLASPRVGSANTAADITGCYHRRGGDARLTTGLVCHLYETVWLRFQKGLIKSNNLSYEVH